MLRRHCVKLVFVMNKTMLGTHWTDAHKSNRTNKMLYFNAGDNEEIVVSADMVSYI